jgi:hypothetical protein
MEMKLSGSRRIFGGFLLAAVIAVTAPLYARGIQWCDTSILECPECYAWVDGCSQCWVTGSGCNQVITGYDCSSRYCQCSSGSGYECTIIEFE